MWKAPSLSLLHLLLLAGCSTGFVVSPSFQARPLASRKKTLDLSQRELLMTPLADLTVPEANELLTPVFAASAIPYAAFVFFFNKLETFPKGATVGFALILAFGGLAGPVEFFTQQTYGVSFFDCDWVHGTISSLFATGYFVTNLSLLQAIRGKPDPGYGPPLRSCALMAASILAVALSEYWNDFQVHSPHFYGVLEVLVLEEPANALSVATWLNHILEISQFQMLLRLVPRWADVSGNDSIQKLTWGLVPLQLSNIAIVCFHLFYNQMAPLYMVFGFLLLCGNTFLAITTSQLASEATSESRPAFPLAHAEFEVPTPTTDSPLMYSVKSLSFALVSSFVVKYGSILVDLPAHLDLALALTMAFAASLLTLWNVQRTVSPLFQVNAGSKS